jgi:hypothetical protein
MTARGMSLSVLRWRARVGGAGRRPTGAVKTGMLRTSSAASFQLLLERLTRSVQANAKIRGTDAEVSRDVGGRAFLEIDLSKDLRVLGLQRRQQRVQAPADDVAQLGIGMVGSVGHLPLEDPALGSQTAVVVDQCVAEQAIEPRHRTRVVSQIPGVLHRPHEGRLQDLFGGGPVAHAALQEGKKLAMLSDERLDDRRWRGGGRVGAVHWRHPGECSAPLSAVTRARLVRQHGQEALTS